jgi:hypothetical protein
MLRDCRACQVGPEDECSPNCILKPAFLMDMRNRADIAIMSNEPPDITADNLHYLLDMIDVY